MVPLRLRQRLHDSTHARALRALPDRKYLEHEIIDHLESSNAKQVLFIGCRAYTSHLPRLFGRHGMTLWTLDIDPEAACYGAPGRHATQDVTRLTTGQFGRRFDAIVFSGVIGFGLNKDEDIERAFAALADVLQPRGHLVVGWNTDQSADPLCHPTVATRFEPSPLSGGASRVTFPNSTHVYDFLQRRSS